MPVRPIEGQETPFADDHLLRRPASRRQQLAVLSALGDALAKARLDTHQVASVAARHLGAVLGGFTAVFVCQEGTLVPAGVHHRDRRLTEQLRGAFDASPAREGHGLLGSAVDGPPALVPVADVERLRRDHPAVAATGFFDAPGVGSIVLVPLRTPDRTVGLALATAPTGEPPFDDVDLAFAVELCARVALALDNARLYAEVRRSSAQLAAVLQAATDAVVTIAVDGTVTSANGSTQTVLGWHPEDLVGRPVSVLLEAGEAAAPRQVLDELVGPAPPGAARPLLVRAVRADGTPFHAEVSVDEIDLDGERLATAFVRDVSERIEHERALRRLANEDHLTGAASRSAMAGLLEELITADTDGSLLVAFVDVDGFKGINDRHGHAAGDEVLRALGRRLRGAVREGDAVGRWGGDEFLVACPHRGADGDPGDSGEELASRLAAVVAQPIRLRDTGTDVEVTASIGVAVHSADGTTVDELVAAADARMYARKASRGAA